MLEQLKHQSSKVAPRHLNRVSTITLREIELKSMLYFFHSTKSSNERNERTFPAKFVLERSSVLPPADAAVRRRISERHVRVEKAGDEFLGTKKNWGSQIWLALSSKVVMIPLRWEGGALDVTLTPQFFIPPTHRPLVRYNLFVSRPISEICVQEWPLGGSILLWLLTQHNFRNLNILLLIG
jgi:hypothetical protein